jgi:hypothetical protein
MAFSAICCGSKNTQAPYLVDILIDRIGSIYVRIRHILKWSTKAPFLEFYNAKNTPSLAGGVVS